MGTKWNFRWIWNVKNFQWNRPRTMVGVHNGSHCHLVFACLLIMTCYQGNQEQTSLGVSNFNARVKSAEQTNVDFFLNPSRTSKAIPQHIEAETKWQPFLRWHFQMLFLEWKCMNFYQYFTEVCTQGSNQQYFIIGSDNGLVPAR